MNRLAVTENGSIIFAMEKGPSENQEDFEEWYVTSPVSYTHLGGTAGEPGAEGEEKAPAQPAFRRTAAEGGNRPRPDEPSGINTGG